MVRARDLIAIILMLALFAISIASARADEQGVATVIDGDTIAIHGTITRKGE